MHSGGRTALDTSTHTRTTGRQEGAAAKRQLPEPGGGPLSCNVTQPLSLDNTEHAPCKGGMRPGAGARECLWSPEATNGELSRATPAVTPLPRALSHARLNACPAVSRCEMIKLDPTAVRNKSHYFSSLSKIRLMSSPRKETLQHSCPSRCAPGLRCFLLELQDLCVCYF